jgi:hypothetical protein
MGLLYMCGILVAESISPSPLPSPPHSLSPFLFPTFPFQFFLSLISISKPEIKSKIYIGAGKTAQTISLLERKNCPYFPFSVFFLKFKIKSKIYSGAWQNCPDHQLACSLAGEEK